MESCIDNERIGKTDNKLLNKLQYMNNVLFFRLKQVEKVEDELLWSIIEKECEIKQLKIKYNNIGYRINAYKLMISKLENNLKNK